MTRYMVDKVLWRGAREPDFLQALMAQPEVALSAFELAEHEKSALAARNFRSIFQLGAHPFLLYAFAIACNGGWSFAFMHEYVGQLKGLELGDIET